MVTSEIRKKQKQTKTNFKDALQRARHLLLQQQQQVQQKQMQQAQKKE